VLTTDESFWSKGAIDADLIVIDDPQCRRSRVWRVIELTGSDCVDPDNQKEATRREDHLPVTHSE